MLKQEYLRQNTERQMMMTSALKDAGVCNKPALM
jgi:hypothetical protein